LDIIIDSMQDGDWERVRAIYLEGLATGQASFETEAPSWEHWDEAHLGHSRLVARDGDRLVAACPLYVKNHSEGEFVFDWAWAEAYQRAGMRYYPKLVAAAPLTPVAGRRLLGAADDDTVLDALLARADLIVVEWLPAAQGEAGEFVRAAPGTIDPARVTELGKLLVKGTAFERRPHDVIVYKSVGIGLEDVALANLVFERVR